MSKQKPQYDVVLHTAADRELASLTGEMADLLVDRLQALGETEQPTSKPYCKQLEDHDDLFRVKAGKYRAILTLEKPQVRILAVDCRSRIYDKIELAKSRGGL